MSLEVVIGPMFSGKSSYALSYVRRQRAIGKTVLVIKPNIDNRYSNEDLLITHDKEHVPCMTWPVENDLANFQAIKHFECIVFEEAQFFKGLINLIKDLLHLKKNVLVVGLDGDSNQKPFGEVFECIPWATTVTKLNALCCKCKNGTVAPYTRRITADNTAQIDVGGSDKYESVCLKHLIHIG